ncbi:hypothetical protein FB451DRAFT_1080409, partial [Mycena latifolia]
MASNGHSLPLFPTELERKVFEMTAELYPETIYDPCLLLVAKRVYEWIEPIKYRTVTSVEYAPACPFRLLRNAIRSNFLKRADFFHTHVRHLFLDQDMHIDAQGLPLILSACSGIQSLALVNCAGPTILPCLAVMRPRRLSVDLTDLFGRIDLIDLSHPTFDFVTHLESFDDQCWFKDFYCSNFALLPSLTHLAISELSRSSAMDLLFYCPKLKVLVRMHYTDLRPSIDDARF